jgi:selenocysteine lyase/cysteine desulfurase
LINASPEEVAILYTTSEGENIVANSIPWVKGDNVVIDDLHYEAAFVIYRQLEARHGVELRIARTATALSRPGHGTAHRRAHAPGIGCLGVIGQRLSP